MKHGKCHLIKIMEKVGWRKIGITQSHLRPTVQAPLLKLYVAAPPTPQRTWFSYFLFFSFLQSTCHYWALLFQFPVGLGHVQIKRKCNGMILMMTIILIIIHLLSSFQDFKLFIYIFQSLNIFLSMTSKCTQSMYQI